MPTLAELQTKLDSVRREVRNLTVMGMDPTSHRTRQRSSKSWSGQRALKCDCARWRSHTLEQIAFPKSKKMQALRLTIRRSSTSTFTPAYQICAGISDYRNHMWQRCHSAKNTVELRLLEMADWAPIVIVPARRAYG